MLAYKVLSSKKKRITYDESLSSTWDELRGVDRDISYKVSTEHTVLDKDGNRVFDAKSFNDAFNNNRNDGDRVNIQDMMKEASQETDLGLANPFFGKVAAISVDQSAEILERKLRERDVDVDFMPNQNNATFESLRQNWDHNLFNQIFNTMKGKKQELSDYDGQNADEFLATADPIFGSSDPTSDWNSSSSTLFGGNNVQLTPIWAD